MNIVIPMVQGENGFVFLQKSDKSWNFPGGKILQGETVGQAAVREVFETTGLDVEMIGVLGTRNMGEDVFIYAYCSHKGGRIEIIDHDRYKKAEWKTPQEIADLSGNTLYEPVRAILNTAQLSIKVKEPEVVEVKKPPAPATKKRISGKKQ